MYSVVLMMALSGGTESADFGRKCHGSDACSGAKASCHGRAPREKHARAPKCHGRAPKCHGAPVSTCSGACHGGKAHRAKRCHGCHGAAPACCGAVVAAPGCTGGTMEPMAPKVMPKEKVPTPPAKVMVPTPATIVVTLPADARLTVDGSSTTSTSDRRTFVTPALEVGADYVYTLQATVGSEVVTRLVTVRGGQTTNVSFSFSQTVASR